MSPERIDARHDRPDPRLLGDAAQLGALDRPLRGPGLPRPRARVPRLRGRGRGAQRRPVADRGADRARRSSSTSRRSSASSTRRRSSWATRPAGCSCSSCSTTASAPPAWRSTRRRPRACAVVPLSQIKADVPGAQEPRQPPPRRRLHARAVALRVHQHVQRGGVARALRALPHPGVRARSSGAACSPTSSPATGHLGRLPQRRPRAAAVHLRQRGPPDAAEDPAVERQALQVATRSPRSRSSRAARTCCPRRRAGRRSPTTRSTGRSSTHAQSAAR